MTDGIDGNIHGQLPNILKLTVVPATELSLILLAHCKRGSSSCRDHSNRAQCALNIKIIRLFYSRASNYHFGVQMRLDACVESQFYGTSPLIEPFFSKDDSLVSEHRFQNYRNSEILED